MDDDGQSTVDWSRWFKGLQRAQHMARDLDQEARLERARALMDTHFDHPLDLATLARSACFSRYHFLRLFKQTYGETPHQYLTQRRLERARTLLRESDLRVTDVCFEVGFQSLGSFSALFHRHVGHSPARYRRRFVQSGWDARRVVPWCMWSRFGNIREVATPQR